MHMLVGSRCLQWYSWDDEIWARKSNFSNWSSSLKAYNTMRQDFKYEKLSWGQLFYPSYQQLSFLPNNTAFLPESSASWSFLSQPSGPIEMRFSCRVDVCLKTAFAFKTFANGLLFWVSTINMTGGRLRQFHLCSYSLAASKSRYQNELSRVHYINVYECYILPNKSKQAYSWSNSHRSHQTCRSPWSWSGRWVVWCTRSRRSSSPPPTAAHTTHKPTETGSLPCQAPGEVSDVRIKFRPQLPEFTTDMYSILYVAWSS